VGGRWIGEAERLGKEMRLVTEKLWGGRCIGVEIGCWRGMGLWVDWFGEDHEFGEGDGLGREMGWMREMGWRRV